MFKVNIFRGNNEKKEKVQEEINQLYTDYDKEAADYDKLQDTVETLQEDYNKSKEHSFHKRYGILKGLIKKNVRKIRQMERQSNMLAKNGQTPQQQQQEGGVMNKLLAQCQDFAASKNKDAVNKALTDYSNNSTSQLVAERNRLQTEIALYKERNIKIKELFFTMDQQYQESKAETIPGRYEDMKAMIKHVLTNAHP